MQKQPIIYVDHPLLHDLELKLVVFILSSSLFSPFLFPFLSASVTTTLLFIKILEIRRGALALDNLGLNSCFRTYKLHDLRKVYLNLCALCLLFLSSKTEIMMQSLSLEKMK